MNISDEIKDYLSSTDISFVVCRLVIQHIHIASQSPWAQLESAGSLEAEGSCQSVDEGKTYINFTACMKETNLQEEKLQQL